MRSGTVALIFTTTNYFRLQKVVNSSGFIRQIFRATLGPALQRWARNVNRQS